MIILNIYGEWIYKFSLSMSEYVLTFSEIFLPILKLPSTSLNNPYILYLNISKDLLDSIIIAFRNFFISLTTYFL